MTALYDMSAKNYIEKVSACDKLGNMSNKEDKHPSYGCVEIGSIQGGYEAVFMSPLRHNNRMRLTIKEAVAIRDEDLHTDRMHPGREIISVEMSMEQFAGLICRVGFHGGTPCTITRRDGKPIPRLETGRLKSERYFDETQTKINSLVNSLKAMATDVENILVAQRISQKAMNAVMGRVQTGVRTLTESLPWATQMLYESMVKIVDSAKLEIETSLHQAQAMLRLAGQSEEVKTLPMLESQKEDRQSDVEKCKP